MENLLSNQPIRKNYSHFLDCDWPAIKFLYFGTSAIFTSAWQDNQERSAMTYQIVDDSVTFLLYYTNQHVCEKCISLF